MPDCYAIVQFQVHPHSSCWAHGAQLFVNPWVTLVHVDDLVYVDDLVHVDDSVHVNNSVKLTDQHFPRIVSSTGQCDHHQNRPKTIEERLGKWRCSDQLPGTVISQLDVVTSA